MACRRPFIVGAGCLSDYEMRSGANALAKVWGGDLIEFSCFDDPIKVLSSLPQDEGLAQLLGDAAMHNSYGGSWLEALGGWRQPIILMAVPSSSGDLPGVVSAYSALCESLCVPLVGIVQLGGDWNPFHRKLDGLPWCGWLQRDSSSDLTKSHAFFQYEDLKIEETVLILRQRIIELNL